MISQHDRKTSFVSFHRSPIRAAGDLFAVRRMRCGEHRRSRRGQGARLGSADVRRTRRTRQARAFCSPFPKGPFRVRDGRSQTRLSRTGRQAAIPRRGGEAHPRATRRHTVGAIPREGGRSFITRLIGEKGLGYFARGGRSSPTDAPPRTPKLFRPPGGRNRLSVLCLDRERAFPNAGRAKPTHTARHLLASSRRTPLIAYGRSRGGGCFAGCVHDTPRAGRAKSSPEQKRSVSQKVPHARRAQTAWPRFGEIRRGSEHVGLEARQGIRPGEREPRSERAGRIIGTLALLRVGAPEGAWPDGARPDRDAGCGCGGKERRGWVSSPAPSPSGRDGRL